MKTAHAEPITGLPTPDQAAAEAITVEACAAASDDFHELWVKQRVQHGGTLERDRNLFVLGAAYGLAWAMRNLECDGQGNVECPMPIAECPDEEGGEDA